MPKNSIHYRLWQVPQKNCRDKFRPNTGAWIYSPLFPVLVPVGIQIQLLGTSISQPGYTFTIKFSHRTEDESEFCQSYNGSVSFRTNIWAKEIDLFCAEVCPEKKRVFRPESSKILRKMKYQTEALTWDGIQISFCGSSKKQEWLQWKLLILRFWEMQLSPNS